MTVLWRRLAIALACLLVAAPAPAVLIASGDGTGNTTAPPTDPGWSHIGALNGLSGVYLGDGWVLTANHVGTGSITLGGVSYPVVPDSSMRLEHTPGVLTDLLLFRLISDPDLTTLPIAVTPPPLSTQAILIGRGTDRGAAYTFNGHAGWRWASTHAQRWGTNAVSQASFELNLSGQPLRALGFSFDNLGGTTPEAIVTTGDSGGAAFVGGSLAGILVARWSYGGQASQSSVFGNGTYVADLSYYRNEILAITAELSCSNGLDDDGDGLADLDDPGCYGLDDPFETNAIVPCDDGFDNDADGLVDWPDDPGCQDATSLKEDPLCDDGVDNDLDGLVDWPDDPGCHFGSSPKEDPACDDGVDNDGDGAIDWDGGPGGTPDPNCASKPWRTRESPSSGCGLGCELVFLAPLAARLARRKRSA